MSIGQKIKALRISTGLTQPDLARHLDLSKATISLYELDKTVPSPPVLKKMAEIFGVSVTDLVDNNTVEFTKLDNPSLMERMFAEFQAEIKFLRSQLEKKDSMIDNLLGKSSSVQHVRAA